MVREPGQGVEVMEDSRGPGQPKMGNAGGGGGGAGGAGSDASGKSGAAVEMDCIQLTSLMHSV